MANSKGSKWHPARVSERQKQTMARDVNNILEESKKDKSIKKPIDFKKGDWSITF